MPQSDIRTLPLSVHAGFSTRLLTALTNALARRRDRQRLARLDTHLLRDIGLDPQQVRSECTKPIWQP